jgi:hypothetical protein
MEQFTTNEKSAIECILARLQELDTLYRSFPLAAYEETWQAVAQEVSQQFSGFTVAYAEIYTAGSEREAHGGMRHVLLPIKDISPGHAIARK